jgi:hypothetical protein
MPPTRPLYSPIGRARMGTGLDLVAVAANQCLRAISVSARPFFNFNTEKERGPLRAAENSLRNRRSAGFTGRSRCCCTCAITLAAEPSSRSSPRTTRNRSPAAAPLAADKIQAMRPKRFVAPSKDKTSAALSGPRSFSVLKWGKNEQTRWCRGPDFSTQPLPIKELLLSNLGIPT